MDFKEQIKELGKRVVELKEHTLTEEATKNAFIMPFLQILGFNVFNPMEVKPEFTADVGTKKGEKVDYAIFKDGRPILLVECKHWEQDLVRDNEDQLLRYFHACKSKFALLTNGIDYRFYTDLEEQNKMDRDPFLSFNITNMKDAQIAELKKFSKAEFNEDLISATATELKYTSALRKELAKAFKDPDDDFVRFFASKVYDGRLTSGVMERFKPLFKKTLDSYLMDMIKDSLNSALAAEKAKEEQAKLQEAENQAEQAPESEIVTTEEELEGYRIVKAIVCQKIPASRVVLNDKKAYCAIILDGNTRKPICRFYYNGRKKYLALFNIPSNFKGGGNKEKNVVQLSDENPNDDIYKYSDALLQTIDYYEHPELVPDVQEGT